MPTKTGAVIVDAMGTEGKAALRARLLAARRAVADDRRAAEAQALQRHLAALTIATGTVCAYVPVGAEPGSLSMLDTLLRGNLRVLLPVARTSDTGVPLPLLWGEYQPGRLVGAEFGLLEPPEPWLPTSALAEAGMVLVPALAVDRHGVRLGRGAGFYDRTLVARHPDAQLVTVVRDEELLAKLPSEPHDVRMTHALTPGRGVTACGTGIMVRE